MSTLSQSLISAGAAVVGTLAGSLVTWATFRQSRAERRDDRRRDAYAKFIGATEELERLMNRSLTVETELAPESTLNERVAHLVGSVERAYVAVVLAGPPRAKEAAHGVRTRAWALLDFLLGTGKPPGQVVILVGQQPFAS